MWLLHKKKKKKKKKHTLEDLEVIFIIIFRELKKAMYNELNEIMMTVSYQIKDVNKEI